KERVADAGLAFRDVDDRVTEMLAVIRDLVRTEWVPALGAKLSARHVAFGESPSSAREFVRLADLGRVAIADGIGEPGGQGLLAGVANPGEHRKRLRTKGGT